jgi:hypothetical protein
MSGPFATAAELSEWLGLAVPDDLARLQALLDSASALIRGSAGQVLSAVSDDVIVVQPEFDQATGRRNPPPRAWGDTIYLPEAPVTTVTIEIDAAPFTEFGFTEDGTVYRTDGKAWTTAAEITYDHGYAETSEEFKRIRTICIESALRAYAPNASGSPAVLNSITLESAGYAPAVFLTENERNSLPSSQTAAVG